MSEFIRWGFVLALVMAVTTLVGLLSKVTPSEIPQYGHRGAERRRALDKGGLFALCEPVIRFIAGIIALLPLTKLREQQEHDLRRADDALGLTSDELSALAVSAALLLCVTVGAIGRMAQSSSWWMVGATVFGLLLPTLQVREIVRKRAKSVTRALPPAIEIAAMCMGAGLDFPGALRMLAERNSPRPSPLGREFAVVLEHLEFGQTRKEALERFAESGPESSRTRFRSRCHPSRAKGQPACEGASNPGPHAQHAP